MRSEAQGSSLVQRNSFNRWSPFFARRGDTRYHIAQTCRRSISVVCVVANSIGPVGPRCRANLGRPHYGIHEGIRKGHLNFQKLNVICCEMFACGWVLVPCIGWAPGGDATFAFAVRKVADQFCLKDLEGFMVGVRCLRHGSKGLRGLLGIWGSGAKRLETSRSRSTGAKHLLLNWIMCGLESMQSCLSCR